MTPTVSVVIPTFNRGTLLPHALESVLKQTYKDYEIVVVDDGSGDDTREKLKPYLGRIQYVYQDNRGLSAAQNKGIELAKGEWISILADDDEWLPTKLQRQIEAIDTLGEDFGACFTDCQFVGNADLQQTAFQAAGLGRHDSFGILEDPVRYVLARHPSIFVQSLLIRRSLINEIGGFDEAMLFDDTDLILRLVLKTKLCFVSEPLVIIDRTPSQPRLSSCFSIFSDKLFAGKEGMFRKWLSLSELVDAGIRSRIHKCLGDLYLEWAIRKLDQCRFSEAIRKMRQAREIGSSYLFMLPKLASRAGRKTARKICAPLTGQIRSQQ